jgi:hypothetical protein
MRWYWEIQRAAPFLYEYSIRLSMNRRAYKSANNHRTTMKTAMAETNARLRRGKHLIGSLILSAVSAVVWANPPKPAPAPPHVAAPVMHAAGPVAHPGLGAGGPHPGPGGFHGGPGGPHPGGPHFAFHGRDVRHFGHEDLVRWRGGRWNRTCFDGRCGWWWFAGGQWYFYDAPVYPYPVVVSEVAYVEPGAPVAVAPVAAPLNVAPPPRIYYYCDNPPGYYPAVSNCSTQFRQVAAPPR